MLIYTIENGIAVPYERSGHCSQCGDCCVTYTMLYSCTPIATFKQDRDPDDIIDYSEKEGWHSLFHHGCWWWFNIKEVLPRESPCKSYDPFTKSCTIWQDEFDFKPICRYWPFHPNDLIPFPNCTFTFTKLEE